jgi:two-component system sensor histidine kinase BaeS
VIRVQATAIRDGRNGADLDSQLALIERCAQRMQHIAVDILDDVRRTTDRISLELAWTPVNELVDDAILSVRDVAAARGIALSSDDSDRVVLCDRFRIVQILVNLLDNAIKYTPRGGHVSLTTTPVGGRTRITVSDDGRGIAPEDVPKLFDRYWRNSAGTGIGLATAQALAVAHGAELKVTTVLGAGTTFYFELASAQ